MKRKGYTLIELMITLAILSILSLFLYQTFFSQIRKSFSFKNNIDIQRNINEAVSMLTDEIRNYSFTNITVMSSGGSTQVFSDGRVIIDLSSNSSAPDIYYDSANKTLRDKNGNHCFDIDSIQINRGVNSGENELILITVSASHGNEQITTSTAVNIKK